MNDEKADLISILAAKLQISEAGRAHRLYKDVESSAKVFCHPPDLRPSALLKKAKKYLTHLESGPNFMGEIPDQLRSLLAVPDDFQEEALRGDPLDLLSEVRKACAILENDLTVAHDQRGGRASDLLLNPHLFRHALAKIVIDRDPNAIHVVQQVLGHTTINTTLAHYLGTETKSAGKHLDSLLERTLHDKGDD